MSSTKSINTLVMLSLLALLAACAGSSEIWGDPESGLILEYRLPAGTKLSYDASSRSTENVEVMGQSMQVKTASAMIFTAVSKAATQKVHDLSVTIDSSMVSIMSPRGELKGDTKDVVGKTFGMQLTALGKELNLTGTEEIQYGLGPAGKRSATTTFSALFADMAGKPVKIGDSWPTRDTIRESGGGMEVLITLDGQSALDGLAPMMGYECARIVSTYQGKVHGQGKQGPMELVTDGTMKGTDTTYFAYREGFLVLSTTRATVEAVTEGTGPQNLTIPSTRESTIDVRLLKGPAPIGK